MGSKTGYRASSKIYEKEAEEDAIDELEGEREVTQRRDRYAVDSLERPPEGALRRVPKEAHGRVHKTVRSIIRAEWESGESSSLLAKRHGISSRSISRWIAREEWERSADDAPSAILQHARREIQRKVETARVEATAAIEDVLSEHKGTSHVLKSLLHEATSRALAYPHKDPFRQLLAIKVASEVAKNIQSMDRKTWGFDENKTKTTTQIFDVLSTMGEKVERQALAADRSGDIKADHGK
tara:strand:- start:14656 stop:15375 length:720 start_codon:yes stop_codon:yes gene_type:complete